MRISDWSSDVCSSDLVFNCSSMPCSCSFMTSTCSGASRYKLPSANLAASSACLDSSWAMVSGMASSSRCSHEVMRATLGGRAFSAATASFFRALFSSRRSEEHTSELQSLMRISYAVFCLKKKTNKHEDTRSCQYTKE